MKDLYICTKDRQGEDWCVGEIDDWKGWQERAMGWADSDEHTWLVLTLAKLEGEAVIRFIDETWDIDIEKVKESNNG